MGKCVIFCAGEFTGLAEPVKRGDLVIAADGGYRYASALGITPDIVLGDFDSLGYVPENSRVFPVEKDDTDAMLAVRYGLEQGYKDFVLYGTLDGPRLDHTIANLQTLQFLADRQATGFLVGCNQIATVVHSGCLALPATYKGTVSVFCMGADARKVTIEGLKYTLQNGTLSAGFPLGVSNAFTGQNAKISVGEGSLLIIYARENGIK